MTVKKISCWIALLFFVLSSSVSVAKVTPSDVFARLALADQHLDKILFERNIKNGELETIEKGLEPMHVYQMIMACSDLLRNIQLKEGLRPFPIMAVAPMKYTPADVLLLAEIIENQIERVAEHSQIETSGSLYSYNQKTPTDVFEKALNVFVKLMKLSGAKNISPNVAYSQMARAVTDAEYILVNIDAYSRYRNDAPISAAGLTPTDVYQRALQVRQTINAVRKFYQLPIIPIPAFDGDKKSPRDVFIQSQIIIAELNIIKLATNTFNITPVPIPVSGKKPTNVHQKVSQIDYLMKQISSLTAIVAQSKQK